MSMDAKTLLAAATAAGYDRLCDDDLKKCILVAATSGGSGFASAQLALTQDAWTVAHGLGAKPSVVRLVLVCIGNDANTGLTVGKEVDVVSVSIPGDGSLGFGFSSDATNVYAVSGEIPVGNEGDFVFIIAGNTTVPSSFNNFQLKVYAKL